MIHAPLLCLYGNVYNLNDADMSITSILCLGAARHPECAIDCSLRGPRPVHSPHVSPYTRSETIHLFRSQSPMQSWLPLICQGPRPMQLERLIGASILHDSILKIVMNTTVAASRCTFCLLTVPVTVPEKHDGKPQAHARNQPAG